MTIFRIININHKLFKKRIEVVAVTSLSDFSVGVGVGAARALAFHWTRFDDGRGRRRCLSV